MKMKRFNLIAALLFMGISTSAMSAQPRQYDFTPSAEKLFVATAGEVILTFLSKDAAYSNDLYLQGTSDSILNNQTAAPGAQYSLGTFLAGAELSFTMFVKNTGFAYYTGSASLNPDSFIHAAYDVTSAQSLNIGFEDLFNGGDKDYDDLVFSLNNVRVGTLVTAVPEPQAYAMLLAGLMLIGLARRRISSY
jgi:Domain of unknown function (DUF4114)